MREQIKENGKKYFNENLTTKLSVKLLEDFYDKINEEKMVKEEKQKKKKVMFICSVGGHLTQMLELKPLFKEYKLTSFNLILERSEF